MRTLRLTPMGLMLGNQRFPCAVGRGAVSLAKREGDGATPAGVHQITGLLYRPDRMARPAPWALPIGPRDLWCDAPDHPDYNQAVRAPFTASAEQMRRADPLYDLVMLTDWNWPDAAAGKGSAIFLHQWRKPRHPTEGCIAVSRTNLRALVALTPPGTRLMVPEALARQP